MTLCMALAVQEKEVLDRSARQAGNGQSVSQDTEMQQQQKAL
jgi:hypothetical protein